MVSTVPVVISKTEKVSAVSGCCAASAGLSGVAASACFSAVAADRLPSAEEMPRASGCPMSTAGIKNSKSATTPINTAYCRMIRSFLFPAYWAIISI